MNLDSAVTEKEEGVTMTAAENHAKELFMCGQHDMIAIGGGSVEFLLSFIFMKYKAVVIAKFV